MGEKFNKLKNEFKLHQHLDDQMQSNLLSRTTTDTLGLTIYTDVIKEITLGNYTSYTMRIATENVDSTKFYNLTIEDKNGTAGMFITKYTPTPYWLDNKNEAYEGEIATQRTNNLDTYNENEDIIIEDGFNGTDGGASGGSSSTYPEDCDGFVIATTILTEYKCGCGHTVEDYENQICRGCDRYEPRIPGYEYVTTYECIESYSGDNDIESDNNGSISGGGTGSDSNNTTDSGTSSLTIIMGPDKECIIPSIEVLNEFYSQNSPFNVDLSSVSMTCENIDTIDVENNEKFMCVYNKLVSSPSFKNLFIETFGENEDLNVKFEITDSITGNGIAQTNLSTNPATGLITSFNVEIKINKNVLNTHSSISLAKVIMHESIHAYLSVKQYICGQGTSLDILNDVELAELLNMYFATACPQQSDHEFMFDYLIPTMSQILSEIKDDLVPLNHQQIAETETFIDENDPTGPETPWDWNEFYKYFSMLGLQNSDAFQFEMLPMTSPKYQNFNDYGDFGVNYFSKECNN